MSRRDLVEMLAPTSPPCFADRLSWLEYLVATAGAQSEKGQPAALIFEAGKPVRFNDKLDFCGDCDPLYARVMDEQGRCCPNWLTRSAGEVAGA